MVTVKTVLSALGMDKGVLHLDRRDFAQILEHLDSYNSTGIPLMELVAEAINAAAKEGWRSSPYA